MLSAHSHEPDWVHGHPHDPNPAPPGEDASFSLVFPNNIAHFVAVEALQQFPYCEIENCYIVSTGHGTSGPFRFGGVRLLTVLDALLPLISRGPLWIFTVATVLAPEFPPRNYRMSQPHTPVSSPGKSTGPR